MHKRDNKQTTYKVTKNKKIRNNKRRRIYEIKKD